MSTPIIIGGGGTKAALKKWGVRIGAGVASVGAGMVASPEFNKAVLDLVTGAVGAKAFGATVLALGVNQAFWAARRHLMRIPEPR